MKENEGKLMEMKGNEGGAGAAGAGAAGAAGAAGVVINLEAHLHFLGTPFEQNSGALGRTFKIEVFNDGKPLPLVITHNS